MILSVHLQESVQHGDTSGISLKDRPQRNCLGIFWSAQKNKGFFATSDKVLGIVQREVSKDWFDFQQKADFSSLRTEQRGAIKTQSTFKHDRETSPSLHLGNQIM